MIITESEFSDSKAPTVRSGDSEAPASPPPYIASLSPENQPLSDGKRLPNTPPLSSPRGSTPDFDPSAPPLNLPPRCNRLLENKNDHSIKGVWHVDTALSVPEALCAPLEEFDGEWNESDPKKRKKDKGKRRSSDSVPTVGPDAGVRPNLMLRSKNGSINGEVHVVSSDGVARPGLIVAEGHNGSVSLEVNSYTAQPLRIFAISKNGAVRVRIPQSFEGAIIVSTRNGSTNISDPVKARLTTFSGASGTRGFIGDWQAAKFGSTPTPPASPALSLDPAADPPLPTIPADPFTTWTGPLVHVASYNGSVNLSFVAEGSRSGGGNGGGFSFRGFMSGLFGGNGGEGGDGGRGGFDGRGGWGRRGGPWGHPGPWGPGGENGGPWGAGPSRHGGPFGHGGGPFGPGGGPFGPGGGPFGPGGGPFGHHGGPFGRGGGPFGHSRGCGRRGSFGRRGGWGDHKEDGPSDDKAPGYEGDWAGEVDANSYPMDKKDPI
ncbi:hypothetical protein FRC12_014404 [Ceratobasidium sp. 428]|nr:hypothetical protein FRC12_014404 [Ceratobasidium sp. 428]